ncbi:putative cell agglutination protein pfl8 [Paramyrothecium foliicola]|nr:putative cell agglutination protein pfl8 [Paramyrothecium foliicola]
MGLHHQMKLAVATLSSLGLVGLVAADPCQNNCGRAVAGAGRVSPALVDRRAMCSQALITTSTITPPAATITAPIVYVTSGQPAATLEDTLPSAPTVGSAPAYASACPDDAAYRSACQCFSDVAPTTVIVTAATPTETLPGPTCTYGVEYAIYNYELNTTRWDNLRDAKYTLDRTVNLRLQFSGIEPNMTGVTTRLGTIEATDDPEAPVDIYGITGPPGSLLGRTVIDHRGYFIPPIEGFFSIWIEQNPNDAVYAWFGDAALRTWSVNNPHYYRYSWERGGLDNRLIDVRPSLVGRPMPFRILWLNYGETGAFRAAVRTPTTSHILGPATGPDQRIIASCSGPGAPVGPWVPWANEL